MSPSECHAIANLLDDFSVRIRSRGYQPPENQRWEASFSTGIGITKHSLESRLQELQ
jgi:hypothetical protein